MAAHIRAGSAALQVSAKVAPFIVVALAAMAVRTPPAAAHPVAALLLFSWIVADTLMLSLLARSSGKPEARAVLAALAGACVTILLAVPPVIRHVLLDSPPLLAMMAAILLGHAGWALARATSVLRHAECERWVSALSELLPPPLVRLAAAELRVLHIALFRWGGPPDVPATARGFAYHRHLTPMCATLLILSAIEIAVYHLLVGHWSRTAAIVMFVLSDVGFIYLIGLIKSFRYKPVLLTPEGVHIRAGFLIDRFIPLEAIAAIETNFPGDDVRDPATLNAALLAWPNILLRLDRPLPRRSLLRRRQPYDKVVFRLDEPEPFIRLLRWRLGQRPA